MNCTSQSIKWSKVVVKLITRRQRDDLTYEIFTKLTSHKVMSQIARFCAFTLLATEYDLLRKENRTIEEDNEKAKLNLLLLRDQRLDVLVEC